MASLFVFCRLRSPAIEVLQKLLLLQHIILHFRHPSRYFWRNSGLVLKSKILIVLHSSVKHRRGKSLFPFSVSQVSGFVSSEIHSNVFLFYTSILESECGSQVLRRRGGIVLGINMIWVGGFVLGVVSRVA